MHRLQSRCDIITIVDWMKPRHCVIGVLKASLALNTIRSRSKTSAALFARRRGQPRKTSFSSLSLEKTMTRILVVVYRVYRWRSSSLPLVETRQAELAALRTGNSYKSGYVFCCPGATTPVRLPTLPASSLIDFKQTTTPINATTTRYKRSTFCASPPTRAFEPYPPSPASTNVGKNEKHDASARFRSWWRSDGPSSSRK